MSLRDVTYEVEQFVAAAGWEQPPQLFALVDTKTLLASQPDLAATLDPASPLTPVAQEPLPDRQLDEALASIEWPETVAGCALVQEIIVLPPDIEAELAQLASDPDHARQAAADHPHRREARLVAAVLRDGATDCVMRLRGTGEGGEPDEILQDPELAPNLLAALRATLDAN